MDMSSSREELIETREKEMDKLQIILSLKRLREYQKEAETLKQEQNQEVRKKQKKNKKVVMEKLYKMIRQSNDQYLNMSFDWKMIHLTAANSIINLGYDYSDIVGIKRRIWKKYLDKNTSPSFTLEPATGVGVIIDHIKNMPRSHQISKEDYFDYGTTIVSLAKTDDELKVFCIYDHFLQFFAFRQKERDRWRRMSECDIFKNIWG